MTEMTTLPPYAIIFDLDGTLTNYDHRAEHLMPPNRDMMTFFSKMEDDTVVGWCLDMLLRWQRAGMTIILLTGRPDSFRPHTERWLQKHNISYDLLLMRRADDFRPGAVVKEEIFRQEILGKYHVQTAIDDNPRIIKMWRKFNILGLYCGAAEDWDNDNDVTP